MDATKNAVPASRAINYVRSILFDQKINHFLHEKPGTDNYLTLISPSNGAVASVHFDMGAPGAEKGSPEGPRFVVHEKATASSAAVTHNFTTIEPLLQYLNINNEKISDLRRKFSAAQTTNRLVDSLSPRMGM